MKRFSLRKSDKNPRGGLTSSGRSRYNRATGSNLRPPRGFLSLFNKLNLLILF